MRKLKCIILDDEFEAVNRLESLLLKLNCAEILYKTTNSKMAIEAILEKKPDIVFVDVEMPNISGFEVVDEIRKNEFFPSFIFVTAFNQYAIKAIKKATFDYILKPVNIDELKQVINRYGLECKNSNIIDLHKCSICKDMSEREREVLLHIIEGDTSASIAEKLFISKATVDFHRKNILLKAEAKNFTEISFKLSQQKYSI